LPVSGLGRETGWSSKAERREKRRKKKEEAKKKKREQQISEDRSLEYS
jgi:hypothetical protein